MHWIQIAEKHLNSSVKLLLQMSETSVCIPVQAISSMSESYAVELPGSPGSGGDRQVCGQHNSHRFASSTWRATYCSLSHRWQTALLSALYSAEARLLRKASLKAWKGRLQRKEMIKLYLAALHPQRVPQRQTGEPQPTSAAVKQIEVRMHEVD